MLVDCSASNYAYGVFVNGTLKCRADQDSGGGGLTTDGVYVYNDSTTIYFNTTLAGTNLSVNSSDYWDGYDTANATHFSNEAGVLTLVESFLRSLFIELTDSFGGDVSGTYDNLQVSDDSHLHDSTNITNEYWVNASGDTMSGDLNMGVNNITSVDCILFNSGGQICST